MGRIIRHADTLGVAARSTNGRVAFLPQHHIWLAHERLGALSVLTVASEVEAEAGGRHGVVRAPWASRCTCSRRGSEALGSMPGAFCTDEVEGRRRRRLKRARDDTALQRCCHRERSTSIANRPATRLETMGVRMNDLKLAFDAARTPAAARELAALLEARREHSAAAIHFALNERLTELPSTQPAVVTSSVQQKTPARGAGVFL